MTDYVTYTIPNTFYFGINIALREWLRIVRTNSAPNLKLVQIYKLHITCLLGTGQLFVGSCTLRFKALFVRCAVRGIVRVCVRFVLYHLSWTAELISAQEPE